MRIPYKKLLLGPAVSYSFGALLNFIVLAANNGQMPVMWPGGCPKIVSDDDVIHTCLTASSHLKVLADIFVVNNLGVFSLGDGFLLLGNYLLWPCLILWAGFVIKDHAEKK